MSGYDIGSDTNTEDKDTYWAAKPTEEIGDQILKKVRGYHEFLDVSGRLGILQASYQQYYKALSTYADITRGGASGEFSLISVNEFRNIILHIISLTASERIEYDPVAENTDAESIAQCTLSQGLLEYYLREKRIEQRVKESLENCLWGGEAFATLSWDIGAGDDMGIDPNGRPIKAGDVIVKCYHPGTCVRDWNLINSESERWRITIDLESRFELMAKYPELADRIKSTSSDKRVWEYLFYLDGTFYGNDELIPVYEFRHAKTDAMPNGRLTRIISSDVILVDSPLPYKKIHNYRMVPSNQANSIFGYSVAFDMLPLQSALDSCYSIALSNISCFGVQCIAVPMGSEIKGSDIMNGMKVLYYNSQLGKPEALQLTATAPETYNFLNMIGAAMEKMAAINPVTRGDPGALPSNSSGSAMALIQSMAIQFNSALQQSYVDFAEDIGTGIIEILQSFASQPRVSLLAGKNKKSLMKYWSSKDIASIRRVSVNVGNPAMRTVSGRLNLVEQLLQGGFLKDADQVLEVMNTGKLEPATDYPLAENQLIRDENESFMEGIPTPPIMTDNHDMHIREHGSVIASVDARKNPTIINVVLDHIMQHIALKGQQPPILAQLYNQIIIPPPMPMPGAPGQPPQSPPPGPVGPSHPGGNHNPTPEQSPGAPGGPGTRLPQNPLTGQKFDVETGGGLVSP